jgi:nucleotide-binding universal stress UspA family protein
MSRCGGSWSDTTGRKEAAARSTARSPRPATRTVAVLSVANVPLDPGMPRNFGTLGDISAREGTRLSPPPDVVAHLTEARERLAQAGFEAELLWAAGEPAGEILETARRIRADVIVLGEHHHGFLGKLFGADVDAEVQRAAGCDVILA